MTAMARLGLFVLATLVILAAGVFLIGRRQSVFQSTYDIKATFPNVAGLTQGADVRVGGLHQGTVRHIELPQRPGDSVVVVLGLYPRTRAVVKKDSVATIQSEGLLGDKYVEVTFGSEQGEQVANGDLIKSEPPFDMSNLFRKANDILDSTKGLAANAEDATSHLKQVAAKINEGQGSLGAFIQDKTMYNEATAGAAAFHENMDALKSNFLLRGFFNKRGYTDSDELTKHRLGRLPAQRSDKAFAFDANQLFGKSDSAKLKNEKKLNEAGKFLETNPFSLVAVQVTAGETGDSEKAKVLTEARSVVVRNYLIENFRLDDTRIKTMGVGKAGKPGDSNQVQILIYNAGAKQGPASSQRR